ncbi:flagellar biosynthesis protein FliS [Dyella jiangningensis]|uniref:flagellar export chaperone FliS n=1 Tax=Dyella jiangningensis TaxID=1379159 RepID=UPI0004565F2B|nr:flagellar export chaperone FliS [Dyella jiangningensis]AHX14400.1 flagellar biosynthesis protein FliS [Dyella jiangningensis]MDG2538175.1 flagellar export chaperone FliS [Dyella jiangningensis]
MTYGYARNASAIYQDNSARGSVEGADRHQLTSMLFDGAIDRINQARGAMRRGDVPAKGLYFGKALAIINELRGSLDHKSGAELAGRLDALYDYVTRRLLHAQLNDDERAIDEAIDLLTPVRDAWRQIRDTFLASQGGASTAAA